MQDDFELIRGGAPLLISLPHDGTEIAPEIAPNMVAEALNVADTDWHVGKLYEPLAKALGASLLRPRWSRYVVDLNRPADGKPLYPGRAETSLLPLTSFAGNALYKSGSEPDAVEQQRRVTCYWQPYHQALAEELARLRERFPHVLLWEGHSIRAVCPMFFDGQLPDFNLGTADGSSAAAELLGKLLNVLQGQSTYSHVANGRFKGGYITRQFGRPEGGIHAVQLELTQISYMDEDPPYRWDSARAAPAQRVIERLLVAALAWLGAQTGAA